MALPIKRKVAFRSTPKKPSIGTIIRSELSLNPRRIMQLEAMKEKQKEVEEYQSAVRDARARQAREQMENYAAEERVARAEYAKQDKRNLEQLKRILKSELMLKRIPKELRNNPTFMKNYTRELLNVLNQFGEAENALRNPKFVGAITVTLIENIKKMSPMQKRVYLGNKNNFISLIAQTTENVMEQMQG